MDAERNAEQQERFDALATAALKKVRGSIAKREKLIRNLQGDLEKHGDPERWKRYGELILANIQTAERDGDIIRLIDYFEPDAPTIEIVAEHQLTLNEAAEHYFRRYTKARNGRAAIAERIEKTGSAINADEQELRRIEDAVKAGDEEYLASVTAPKRKATEIKRKKKKDVEVKGVRRFVSSDGFEILVGKKAKDNDFLTFRIARSLDTWLHAADFPGSHVVIHNPNRKPIPDRTLLEAAQLAAFYSNARKLGKAAVNYTQKKYVNKPRRAAPGLVSLASFKTILVEPVVPFEPQDN
jgi:predicted ribosome quality control (RQC) complex YloA/Tae2 family protein